ncbi:hypothetical protein ACROYT_G021086 [Oculina patagonica]
MILESLSCGKRASMRTLSKAMPMNSISWEGLIVLDATTGASRDITTRSRVLKLVKNANLDGSAMTKSSVHDVNNKLEAIVTFKDPFKPVRQLIEKERGTSKPKGRTERRILKEFNSSMILESLSCGKRASMRTLSKAMPMNSISWEGLIVLDATTGASRDITTRSRVLKLVKNANLDGSAMTKSSVHDVNNKLEAIVTFKDPFKPVRQLIEKERGTSKPKGLKETSFGCCTTEIRLGEMEVDVIRSTSSKTIIHYLDAQFARHGLPRGLRSDNGSNLVSKEVEGYLKESEIEHHDTTPLWPRANGQVERQNKTLLKSVRAAHAKGKNWREELNRFLLAYRSTPHSTTGKSPAELLFRSKLKTKMPELVDLEEEKKEVSDQGIRDQDTQRKQSRKDYADKRFHARDRNVREGDTVSLEKKNENKLSSCYENEPYQVMSRCEDQVLLRSSQGVQYKRDLLHINTIRWLDDKM